MPGSSGSPEIGYVDQADLELKHPPISASQVLLLKVCTTRPGLFSMGVSVFVRMPTENRGWWYIP